MRNALLPTLSIVIPSHNRPDLLQVCLTGVTRHAPPGTEILVVDDASPNGTVSQVATAFPGVRILRQPRCRGFCAAANSGILAARGPIVELLNDDTEVMPGWAEASLKAFGDPEVAAVSPLVLRGPAGSSETHRIDSAGDRYFLGGIAGKRGHGESFGPAYTSPCRVFGASGSSAFYRRDALLLVGAFPESFTAYFEDVDLAFRLHRAGYHILFEPSSRIYHHVSASYGRPRRRLLEQQSQNEERVFWRNLPTGALVRALPCHLAVVAAKSWRRWQEGELIPFLSGRLRLLGELPDLARHRKRLRDFTRSSRLEDWQVEAHFWK